MSAMRIANPFRRRPAFVPVIRLSGTIGGAGRFSSGLNDAGLAPLIERAFRAGRPAGVAVVINSPGGSPVQSSLIAARIRRLADEKGVPVHAFVEDVAASGGYWLACAADHIWVDRSSILGSIGVIFASFGFHELMARQGIERRVHAKGDHKSLADPFLPETPGDVARLMALQEPIHRAFIDHVRARRGARLDPAADLFNADVFVGEGAVRAGLADGIGHVVPKMRAVFGDRVRLVAMSQRRPFLSRFGFGSLAAAGARAALAEVEDRAAWSRFGL